MHGVGVVQCRGHQGMPALVVGGDLLLLVVHQPGPLLRPRDNSVDRLVQRAGIDDLAVITGGEQRCLVEDVGEVGAGESGCAARDRKQVHVVAEWLAAGVHLQDLVPAFEVGRLDRDLPVEPARTQQRGVEDVRPVRRRDEDHVGLDVEAVHLDQQLVQRLLALVVTAAKPCSAMASDGVDLVDEDDGGAFSLASLNRSRTREAPTPTNISTKSEPEIV